MTYVRSIIYSKIIIYCFSSSLKILNRRPLPSYNNKLSLHHASPSSDTCSLYKVSLNQELLNQYVEYEKDMPDLKEFTLCMWTKCHNHSQDHPLFSYSGKFRLNILMKVRLIFHQKIIAYNILARIVVCIHYIV